MKSELENLKKRIMEAEIPISNSKNFRLLTWNIRNLNGKKEPKAIKYMAEIIKNFDVIAIQEVNENLGPLDKLMNILGGDYKYIITDVTEGLSGNRERLGFIYNADKVKFKGVAGEIVLPDNLLISDVTKQRQFARTPFACSFSSNWFKFNFATVHIYYGKVGKTTNEYKRRVKEIESIAKFLAKRAKEEDYNYILVGDFNIVGFDDDTYAALEKSGFTVYKNREGSNSDQTKFYDQISFMPRKDELKLVSGDKNKGVFNYFNSIFTDTDFSKYKSNVIDSLNNRIESAKEDLKKAKTAKDKKKVQASIDELIELKGDNAGLKEYFLGEWRTYQASDHMPLWVELEIDFADKYLANLKSSE